MNTDNTNVNATEDDDVGMLGADLEALNAITHTIIGCAHKVANGLGHGVLEACYENALAHELRKAGLTVKQQHKLWVWYDGVKVGFYKPDLLVAGKVLVEIKAIAGLEAVHSAVCINYVTASKLPVCLLINFGLRVQVKRFVGKSAQQSE